MQFGDGKFPLPFPSLSSEGIPLLPAAMPTASASASARALLRHQGQCGVFLAAQGGYSYAIPLPSASSWWCRTRWFASKESSRSSGGARDGDFVPAHQLSSPIPPVATRAELEAAVRAGVQPVSDDSSLEAFRMSNASFPSFHGMVVKAKAIGSTRKGVYADTGVRGIARVRYPQGQRGDVEPGDDVHVQVEAIEGPDGDVYASMSKSQLASSRAEVWAELKSLYQSRRPVPGRLLNKVGSSGWAVGIAGIVAFAPDNRVHDSTKAKIGQLVPWQIIKLDDSDRNVFLYDALVARDS